MTFVVTKYVFHSRWIKILAIASFIGLSLFIWSGVKRISAVENIFGIERNPVPIRSCTDRDSTWQAFTNLNFTSTVYPMTRHAERIVPNLIHFIKFGSTEISFTEMVCIMSAYVNHRPDAIFIHCSLCTNGTTMRGKYWDWLMTRNPPIQVRHIEEPTHIFGMKLASSYHASDIARMLILMEHGGIYFDNDVFVINSLDHFRHYEMSLGWHDGQSMGTQVLLAHRNARFLRLWYDSYRQYNGSLWYYNAGELPTTSILVPRPYLVHRVFKIFGVQMLIHDLYKTIWPDWQDYFAVHLLMRHRSYLDEESPIKEFNETNIKRYNRTFGQMARLVLFNTMDLL